MIELSRHANLVAISFHVGQKILGIDFYCINKLNKAIDFTQFLVSLY